MTSVKMAKGPIVAHAETNFHYRYVESLLATLEFNVVGVSELGENECAILYLL